MSRAPAIPIELTKGPFNLEEARRHGLTKDHLLGASWRRPGGGFYALGVIADDPDVVLAAIRQRRWFARSPTLAGVSRWWKQLRLWTWRCTSVCSNQTTCVRGCVRISD